MNLFRLLSAEALIKMFAAQVGVDPTLLFTARAVANKGLTGLLGTPFDIITESQNLLAGGTSTPLIGVATNLLKDEKKWPDIARFARFYLDENDPSGSIEGSLSAISKLPFKNFDQEHEGLEDFLVSAAFPLLKSLVAQEDICPSCGNQGEQGMVAFDGFSVCATCSHIS